MKDLHSQVGVNFLVQNREEPFQQLIEQRL